jgi:gamma-F420-2:alpha-L-glutamate ligase
MKKVWILYYNNQDESYENTRLVQAFADQNIEARVLRPKLFDIVVSRNSEKSILYEGKRVSLPDLVLTRTGAGSNYFTLAVMRQFEKFGVPVINDADGILKVKDKLMTSQILASNGVPIPKTMLVNFPVDPDVVQKEIGYPCVVKVVSGSKGRGVYLCHKKREFKDLMELLENLKSKKSLIVQEYVDAEVGVDLRVWVIGGKTRAAMKRTAPDGDFRANISSGGTGEDYAITPEIDEIAVKSTQLLGLQIAGVDLLFDRKGFKVCEVNSSPGFEGIDQYCDKDMAREIVDYCRRQIA